MIHFVGAGPGAPDLITLRGAKLLGEAGMIIYAGSLVNKELLALAKPGCAIYDSASMTLDEVVEKFREAEESGVDTVRLHTGDPSIYGAIREQMDRLEALGIEYDVTPGVSSFCAAAAAGARRVHAAGREPDGHHHAHGGAHARAGEGKNPLARLAPRLDGDVPLVGHGARTLRRADSGRLRARDEGRDGLQGIVARRARHSFELGPSFPPRRRSTALRTRALIMVGDFLGDEYELSKLYDKHFSHGFRKASA